MMRITEINVTSFGKLKDYKRTFSSSLNVICEENGFGKSTVAAFIKAMLYGLDDTRKHNLEENERKHYIPWGETSARGSMTIEVGDKKYRIERTIGTKASLDEFKLIDIETGKESSDFSERLGEELFGIDADGFERTVFLSERSLSVANDNKTIAAKLSDLVGCDFDVGNVDSAKAALTERRKYYRKRGGAGHIEDVRRAIAELDGEINDTKRLVDGLPEKEAKLAELKRSIAELEGALTKMNTRTLTVTQERQYLKKKSSRDDTEEKLKGTKAFFKADVPTEDEVREAERRADEIRDLRGKCAAANDGLLDFDEKRGKIENAATVCDGLIEKIKASEPKAEAKRSPFSPLLFTTPVLCALGAIFAAVVGGTVGVTVGAVAIAIGVILLIIGVAGTKRGEKLDTDATHPVDEARSFLLSIGKSIDESEDVFTRLLELKLELNGRLTELDAMKKAAEENDARLTSLLSAEGEYLLRFATVSDEPYAEIREKIYELKTLLEKLAEHEADIAYIVREFNIDPQNLTLESENDPLGKDVDEVTEDLRRKRNDYSLLQRDITREYEEVGRMDELLAKRDELSEEMDRSNGAVAVIDAAISHLTAATDALNARYLGKTRAAFDEYIKFTSEAAENFTMDTSFAVGKLDGGMTRPLEAYSMGTRDAYSLAARLALVDSLYESEKPFIILDDPFAHLDDKRCAAALKLIKRVSEEKQIIYLTCTKARSV